MHDLAVQCERFDRPVGGVENGSIEKILSHLGLPTQPVQPAPAALEADLFGGVPGYTH